MKKESDEYLQQLDAILNEDLKAFNEEILKAGVGGVMVQGVE